MAVGVTQSLVWASLCTGVFGFWVSSRDMPPFAALFVTFIKIAIPFAYFAWFADGQWILFDDMTYVRRSRELLEAGYTPWEALTTANGRLVLLVVANSRHYFYYWWNLLAQWSFGEYYYAPVFFNIGLTFVAGYFWVRILRTMQFSTAYQTASLVFLLLHWELLSWSSLMNLKDTIVLTLTIVSLLLFIWLILRKRQIISILCLAGVFLIFTTIRFYVPVLLIAAVSLWLLFEWHTKRKFLLLGLLIPPALFIILPNTQRAARLLDPMGIFYGSIRFFLTPQPWDVDPTYSFLLLPSIIHWLMLLPAIAGGYLLARRHRFTRLLLLYLVAIVAFYAIFPDSQGPRHRYQVVFLIAWVQFHFLWLIGQHAVRRMRSR
ncbi:MAG: hypothetical protein WBO46_23020 [Caldilineaceae bacterium]